MFRDAVVTRTAVNTLPIIVIAQVIIAVTRAASISILLTLNGLCNGVSVTFKVFLKYMKVGVPLCKFQVWSIVNHCRRFPIQGLPF